MKRTPLKRGKPLRRRTRLRARGDTKYRRRPRDLAYMKWVMRQPCAASSVEDMTPCHGDVEADHAGIRGMGQKADDRTCIPLCHKHHVQRGSFSGAFRLWDQARMRGWLALMVAHYQDTYRATHRDVGGFRLSPNSGGGVGGVGGAAGGGAR